MKITGKTFLAVALLVLWLILAWFIPVLIHLQGGSLWILRIGLVVLGIIGFIAFLWWDHQVQKAEADVGGEAARAGNEDDELDVLFRLAEEALRSSKLVASSKVSRLPVILLVGDQGSGKTTAVLNSGLEPELLAGHVYEDATVVSTQSVNIWLARQTIVVEAGTPVIEDPARWARLVRRLAPAKLASIIARDQAPRAAIVSFDCPNLARQGAVEATARSLQARLREMSQILGISFPVYVLLNRADGLPFFTDYTANLSDAEAAEVWGVTLPLQASKGTGLYGEVETKRVSAAFDAIFYDLDGRRADLLRREHDASKLPGVYEFPREYRKLRAPLVQALVDLCRPSQLVVGPFLRGFYLAGHRTLTVSAGVADTMDHGPITTPDIPVGATGVFDMKKLRAQGSVYEAPASGATHVFDVRKLRASSGLDTNVELPSAQTRTVQQPLFLPHLFSDVLLRDRAALGASGASTKVGFWRRFMLAAAIVVFLVLSVDFIVSYVGNHSLESQVQSAQAAAFTAPPANQVPSTSDLQHLEETGELFDTLNGYRKNGPPLGLRWGLYTGDQILPAACRAYATGFNALLLGPTQASMAAAMKGYRHSDLSKAAADPYDVPYKVLKTYLITTTQGGHAKEDATLSSDLYDNWSAARTLGTGQETLVRKQFDRYAGILSGDANCFIANPDPAAVANARSYLNGFPPLQRIYQAMLTSAASKGGKGIVFNRDYPGSDQVVVNTQLVPAAFTKDGWAAMQDALQHPERYRGGEAWVLGDQTREVPDPQTLVPDLTKTYVSQFVDVWKAFLKASRFRNYKGPDDIAPKIEKVAGANSPLFMTFCLVLKNTSFGVPDKDIQNIFSPARSLEGADCADKPAGTASKDYTDGLFSLETCLQKIGLASSPQDKDTAKQGCQGTVIEAKTGVLRLTAPNQGPDADVNAAVQGLLLAPITSEIVQAQLKTPPPAGAGELCTALKGLSTSFPANSTLDDFQRVFAPGTGLIDLHPLPPPPAKPNPKYAAFFAKAKAIQKALYPEGKTLQLSYKVIWLSSPGVNDFTLTIGSQALTLRSGPKTFVWTGSPQESVQLVANGNQPVSETGSLDIFKFVVNHAPPGQLGANKYLFTIPVVVGLVTTTSPRLNLSIEAGDATVLFKPGALSTLGCTASVGE